MTFSYPFHVKGTNFSGGIFSGHYALDDVDFEFIDEPPPFPE